MPKDALPSRAPQHSVGKVRLESPDALFVADHRVQLPVPAPLYLLSCLRLPLETAYPMTEGGVVANPAHAFQRNVIKYPDGSRFEAEVSGSPALGLPNIYDLDYLLGVGALLEEMGPSTDGVIEGATYRAILRATRPTGRISGSTEQIAGLKRALARWGSTNVRTTMEMVYPEAEARVRNGKHPTLAEGSPKRRERESVHWILEYDLEREERTNGQVTDTIESLRINPIWMAQTASGLASWIRLDLHNRLRSGIAKGVYLRLVLAVAQGWRPSRHTELLSDWIEALGVTSQDRPNKIASTFYRAFSELEEVGALDHFDIAPIQRGVYEVQLMPGSAICDVADLRGIGALDPVRTRVLLSHLAKYRLGPEARDLLQRYGHRVQDVLQWVHYLRTEREGKDAKGNSIVSWRSWILQALSDSWTFDDPEYQTWLKRRVEGLQPLKEEPAAPRIAPTAPAAPPETATPTPDFVPSDDVWGRALHVFRNELPAETFRAWFRDTWLEEVSSGEIRVGTRAEFTRDWIMDKYATRLAAILTEQLGHPVQLVVSTGGASGDQ